MFTLEHLKTRSVGEINQKLTLLALIIHCKMCLLNQ